MGLAQAGEGVHFTYVDLTVDDRVIVDVNTHDLTDDDVLAAAVFCGWQVNGLQVLALEHDG